jgi:hypothetical protein
MKMILNADGVRALIAHDPEGTVEIARNAGEQVAEAMARKLVKRVSEEVVARHLHSAMTEVSGYGWPVKLNEKTNNMISDVIKTKVDTMVDMRATSPIHQSIRETVRAILADEERKFRLNLQSTVDAMIRERFAAAFGGKP